MRLSPETIKTLDDQVKEIAGHLGWEFDQEYADRQEQSWNYHAEIWNGNKRIALSTGTYKIDNRFVIRGQFPRDKKGEIWNGGYNVKQPEITVSMDRGPEKIAHAIQSRLLPEYERQLAIALDRIEKSDAYHAGRLQTLKAVAEYFGQPAPEDDDKAISPNIKNPDGTETSLGIFKIEICSDRQIFFSVTCPIEKALQIVDLLKQKEAKE